MSKKDTWQNAKPSSIVFYQADSDLGEVFEGLPFGRFLGPVAVNANNHNTSYTFLARPFSSLTGGLAWSSPLSMNRAYLIRRMTYWVGLKKLADKRFQKLVKSFLKKTNPKVVLTIGADSWLCESCKEMNIPLVEVLHGRGYNKVPWGWADLPASKLPTHVISFDTRSTETFTTLTPKNVNVIQVNDKWKDFVTSRDLSSSASNFSKNEAKTVVLFTLTWGYDGDHGEASELEGILENGLYPDFVEHLVHDSSLNAEWLFRLHPVQLRGRAIKKYSKILDRLALPNNNVEWKESSLVPLPTLLNKVTHHITMSSMATYQAAEEGIHTLLLCPNLLPGGVNEGLFEDLAKKDQARKIKWDSELVRNWLLSNKRASVSHLSKQNGVGLYEIVENILSGK